MDLYQRTVLVAEDEPMIRMALIDALEEEGYLVIEAGNVLEAVVALGRNRIDILITDIDMPGGLNGLDLARLVRTHDKAIRTLVTSGGHSPGYDDLPEGACFLPKPYRLDDVISRLEGMMPRSDDHYCRLAV